MAVRKKVVEEPKEELSLREQMRLKKQGETKRKTELVQKINAQGTAIQIEIMNNKSGEFIYECPQTKIAIKIQGYGGTEMVTYEMLKVMANRYKKMLEKYWIIPVGIYGVDDVTLQDVFEVLKIDSLYDEDMLLEDNIDYIIKELNAKQFKQILAEYNTNYKRRIIERAVELAKLGELNDNAKRLVLSSIDESCKETFDQIDEDVLINED